MNEIKYTILYRVCENFYHGSETVINNGSGFDEVRNN